MLHTCLAAPDCAIQIYPSALIDVSEPFAVVLDVLAAKVQLLDGRLPAGLAEIGSVMERLCVYAFTGSTK